MKRFVVSEEQQNIHSVDIFPFIIWNMSTIDLSNITNSHKNDSTNYSSGTLTSTRLIYTIILGLVCVCLCFLTITGNFLVLITFRRMRTVGNLFILSLATADLIVGCFVMPIAGIYAIMEEWKMGLILCQIWLSVDFTASTASIFNLLTLSLDRYWSITSPLQYLGKRTRTRALLLIGFAWGLSLLWVIPIFGWDYFVNGGKRSTESDKCEPAYIHSKVFKVSTAIINFYLPLLVLISLNGRIYYEIKIRYKNVLLQRHSNKMNNSLTTTNNSLYNRKLNRPKRKSQSPVTVTLCDSDRHICSTTINYIEGDSLILSKSLPKPPVNNTTNDNNETILRINFKEKKNRPLTPILLSDHQKSSLKRTYSFVDKAHCTQDELTWFAQRHKHSHSSFTQNSPTIHSNFKYNQTSYHHLHVDERRSKYSNKRKSRSNPSSFYYQATFHNTPVLCRHCSLTDSTKTSPTTMNVFNLCHCCSAATSEITIHSHPFVNNNTNIELYHPKRKLSSSSSSSIPPSSIKRKQQHPISNYNNITNSRTSSLIQRTSYQTANKIKQATVWNQQEKAFRQLFAIVFGFTCCFLPYFILYMVVAFCESCISERVTTATIWLGYVNSTINPFLYALSNKHFRRTFNRLIKRDNRRQSYYN